MSSKWALQSVAMVMFSVIRNNYGRNLECKNSNWMFSLLFHNIRNYKWLKSTACVLFKKLLRHFRVITGTVTEGTLTI